MAPSAFERRQSPDSRHLWRCCFSRLMGVRLMRAAPVGATTVSDAERLAGSPPFRAGLAQPMTMSFIAVFATLGGDVAGTRSAAVVMVLGVLKGSARWLALALACSHPSPHPSRITNHQSHGRVVPAGFAAWQRWGFR
jgi:hypothetical protein